MRARVRLFLDATRSTGVAGGGDLYRHREYGVIFGKGPATAGEYYYITNKRARATARTKRGRPRLATLNLRRCSHIFFLSTGRGKYTRICLSRRTPRDLLTGRLATAVVATMKRGSTGRTLPANFV